MVSQVGSIDERRVIRMALTELGLRYERLARASVTELPHNMGHVVTVVHLAESLKVYLLHVHQNGDIVPMGGGAGR